jgi:quercetin dioxygenase-like cupin family protein
MAIWEDAEPGVRRRILIAQGRLMLMEVQFAAGSAGYEHQHPHEQISYCVSGRFEYSVDGCAHVLSAGESVYVPGNVRHGAKALDEGTLIDVFTPIATTRWRPVSRGFASAGRRGSPATDQPACARRLRAAPRAGGAPNCGETRG